MKAVNRITFWDGDNFIIVTKKCTKDQAKRLLAAIAEADLGDVEMAPPAALEPEPDEPEYIPVIPEELVVEETEEKTAAELIPDQTVQITRPDNVVEFSDPGSEEKILFSSTRYIGLSPEEVLEQEGDKGYANMAFLVKRAKTSPEKYPMDENLIRAIEKSNAVYFRNKFEHMDPFEYAKGLGRAECQNFYRFFSAVLSEDAESDVLKQSGYQDMKQFIDEGTGEQLKALVAVMIANGCDKE